MNELYAEIDRLRAALQAERELREKGCYQEDGIPCPNIAENETLRERAEYEARRAEKGWNLHQKCHDIMEHKITELEAALKRETNEYIEASHTLAIERDEWKERAERAEADVKKWIKIAGENQKSANKCEADNAALRKRVEELKELIDGATDAVECFGDSDNDAQMYWREMWLKKAKQAIKETGGER